MSSSSRKLTPLQKKMNSIIFGVESKAGRNFDIILIVIIFLSIVFVNLESVPSINNKYRLFIVTFEWIFTIFFTIEYGLRLYCSYQPKKYALSMYGIIDLLAVIPTYLSFFIVGSSSLMIIRALRLLRVFRIFKMVGFLHQGNFLIKSLKQSKSKIFIFLFFIFVMVNILGSIMYLVEGGANSGFDSIPRSIYWAIVTMTTVGYGDISPVTNIGQFFAAVVMVLGYAVIAVPTGIVSSEMVQQKKKTKAETTVTICEHCGEDGHDYDSQYCKYCGDELNHESN